jgi:hypothetical protein
MIERGAATLNHLDTLTFLAVVELQFILKLTA